MVKRLLVSLVVVIIVGGAVIGYGLSVLHQHAVRNAEVQAEKAKDISITVVEGKRREEIAAQLDKAGVTSYKDFLTASADYEGYLFPDTYRFFPNTPAADVVATMRSNYTKRTAANPPSSDQLVLASIVERESLNDADRATIAGVYANRLRLGMRLNSDPTVQYGKDSLEFSQSSDPKNYKFWTAITQADYQSVDSPYNTYLIDALPPAPIANPGLASIQAAMQPAQHDYLYFVYKNGKLLLAKTLEQHNAQL